MQSYLESETSDNYEYELDSPLEFINSYQFDKEVTFFDSAWDTGLVFENPNLCDLEIDVYYNENLIKTYKYFGQNYFIIPLHEKYYISDIVIRNKSDYSADINYYHMDTDYIADIANEKIC